MAHHETTWPLWYTNSHTRATAPDVATAQRMSALRTVITGCLDLLGRKTVDTGVDKREADPGGGGGGAYTPDNEHVNLGDFNLSSNGLIETQEDWEKVCADLERTAKRLCKEVARQLNDDD